jgi:hypothetical protein
VVLSPERVRARALLQSPACAAASDRRAVLFARIGALVWTDGALAQVARAACIGVYWFAERIPL